MKKLFTRFTIYLIAVTLVVPSWLVLDLLGAQKASASAALGIYTFDLEEELPTNSEITFSPFSRNGLTTSAANNVFNSSGWSTSSPVDRNKYISFSVQADLDSRLNIDTLKFDQRGSATVADHFMVSYLVDDGVEPNDLAEDTVYFSASRLDSEDYPVNITGARHVEFRFYVYGDSRADGTLAAPTNSGTWRVDNIEIDGDISPAPAVISDLSLSIDSRTIGGNLEEGYNISTVNAPSVHEINIAGISTIASVGEYEFYLKDSPSGLADYFADKEWSAEWLDLMNAQILGTTPSFYLDITGSISATISDAFMRSLGQTTALQIDQNFLEGSYIYEAEIDGQTVQIKFDIDNSAPIALLSGAPNYLTNSDTASISVLGTGLSNYKYQIDGGDYSSEFLSSEPIELFGLEDGVHSLSVIGGDITGNWQDEAASTTVNWEIDTTMPVVSIIDQPISVSGNTTPTVTVNVEDGAGFQIKNGDVILISDLTGTGENQIIDLGTLDDGTYDLALVITDTAGNGKVVTFEQFIINTIPPTDPGVLINGGALFTNSRTVDLILASANATEMSFDNGSNWVPFASSYEYTLSDEDGVQTVTATFRNNVAQISATASITLDRIVPTFLDVSISSNNTNSSFAKVGDIVTLKFRSSEQIGTPYVIIAGQSVSAALGDGTNSYVASYTFTSDDCDQLVAFSISGQDAARNLSDATIATTDETSVVLDKTKPVVTIGFADGTSYTETTLPAALNGTAIDANLTSVFVSIKRGDNANFDGAVWHAAASGSYLWLAVPSLADWKYVLDDTKLIDGYYTIRVKAIDRLGNISSTPYLKKSFNFEGNLPTITLIGDVDMTINLNSTYVDLGATATDGLTVLTDSIVSSGSVNTEAAGVYQVRYNVVDLAGKSAIEAIRNIIVLPANKLVAAASTALTPSASQAVLSTNGGDSVITIPQDVTNATIDMSNLVATTATEKQATLKSKLTLKVTTEVGEIDVIMPAGMKISGPTGWNGVINVPTIIKNAAINLPSSANEKAALSTVIEVGFGDIGLTFDKAVRILVPGQAGNLVGYTSGGSFIVINSTCSADTQRVGNNLAPGGDCKIKVGNDLVIWTKHFTQFATYGKTKIVKPVTESNENATRILPVAETPVVSSSPRPIAAEAPVTIVEPATASDDSGIIKGENIEDEANATNWTPWVVLFALIILAGAATGGYLYWFSGKEEIQKEVNVAVRTKVKTEKNISKNAKKPDRRKKRW